MYLFASMIIEGELRINNYFEFKNTEYFNELSIRVLGKDDGIRKLEINDFWASDEFGADLLEFLNPIPLTPEILEKCGFKNGKLNNFFFFQNGNLIIEGYEHDHNGLFVGRVEYLHQLQNIFFALTGEELNIEL